MDSNAIKDKGVDNSAIRIDEYNKDNTKYVIITKRESVEKSDKLSPMHKLLRVGEGFAGGVLSGGFSLWVAEHFASYGISSTLKIPNSGTVFNTLTQGQEISIGKLNFKVLSDSSSSLTLQQVLPNGAPGQEVTVGNSGSEILTIHNGMLVSVQQLSQNAPEITLHAGNGSYEYITMNGIMPVSNGKLGLYATIIHDHIAETQNWVAQGLANLSHQIELVVALGTAGAIMGLVSSLYSLKRRGSKENSG